MSEGQARPSWERYAFAVLRGGMRALPLPDAEREGLIDALDRERAAAIAGASGAVERRTGRAAPDGELARSDQGSLERQAERAWGQLTTGEQGEVQGRVSAVTGEGGPDRAEAVRALGEVFVEVLLSREPSLQARLERAAGFTPAVAVSDSGELGGAAVAAVAKERSGERSFGGRSGGAPRAPARSSRRLAAKSAGGAALAPPAEPAAGSRATAIAALAVVGVAVVVAAGLVVAFGLGGEEAEVAEGPSPTASAASPAPTEPAPVDPREQLLAELEARQARQEAAEALLAEIDESARRGGFVDAIASLEQLPAELRAELDEAALESRLERFRRWRKVQEGFDAALVAGRQGDREALAALVQEVEANDYALAGSPFVETFKQDARTVLGSRVYEKIVYDVAAAEAEASMAAFEEELAEILEEEDGSEIEGPDGLQTTPIEERGAPQRRSRMAGEAQESVARRDDAIEEWKRRRDAARAALVAAAARAAEVTAAEPIAFEGGEWVVTAYDEDGFALAPAGGEGEAVARRWVEAPDGLAFAVRRSAADPEDAGQLEDLARFALVRNLFERARELQARVLELAPERAGELPDVDRIEARCRLFRGEAALSAGDEASVVRWPLTGPYEDMDFHGATAATQVEVADGTLRLTAPRQSQRYTLAELQGRWVEQVELSVAPVTSLAEGAPRPILGFGSRSGSFFVKLGAERLELRPLWSEHDAEPLASAPWPGQGPLRLAVALEPRALHVRVLQGAGGEAASEEVVLLAADLAWEGEVELFLGADPSGAVAFRDLEVRGALDPDWLERARAIAPNEVVVALQERVEEEGGRLPARFAETSAEDDVGLEGIPEAAVAMVAEGRRLLAEGERGLAYEQFRLAAGRSREYHAAHYLAALPAIQRDPGAALFRLERAVGGIEDFYEAHAAVAEARLALGRVDGAERALAEAKRRRAGYAPIQRARALLALQSGDVRRAERFLGIAEVLYPGDPETRRLRLTAEALARGLPWAADSVHETDHYVVQPDTARNQRLANHLEGIHAVLDGTLSDFVRPAGGDAGADDEGTKAQVLVFDDLPGYYRYTRWALPGPPDRDACRFDRRTGQLVLRFDPGDPDAWHDLSHQAARQWLHRNGLPLPGWLAHALSELAAGSRIAPNGEVVRRGEVDEPLARRLRVLASQWPRRSDLYDLLTGEGGIPALDRAMGWSLVHYCCLGGSRPAREAFVRYVRWFVKREAAFDPAARDSLLLDAFLASFYKEDLQAIERGWARWVKRLCEREGIIFDHALDEGR